MCVLLLWLVLAQYRKRQRNLQFDEQRRLSTVYVEVECVVSTVGAESPFNLHSAVQYKCLSLRLQ